VSADEICYISGKKIVITNLATGAQTFLDLEIENTISALIVTVASDSKRAILVAEYNKTNSTVYCFVQNDKDK
jgi:hypothetical protein